MRARSVDIPRVLHVGAGAFAELASLLSADFDTNRVAVGGGRGPSGEYARRALEGLRVAGIDAVPQLDLEGRLGQAASMAAEVIAEDVTLMVAVGGGRVIDTVKLAAARTGTPFISVPTAISHDGLSSPVASLIGQDGRRRSYGATMPAGIVVDLEIISSAPQRMVRAGAGDLASNLTAIRDWQLAEKRGRGRCDAFAAMIAESAAKPVLDLTDLEGPETHEVLAKGLLLSGLAMAAAGTSRPCSGAEHLISHSLDRILASPALHGEQVALGTLFSAAAHDESLHLALHRTFDEIGLPTSPHDLGISPEEMLVAIRRAPETRPERMTILDELDEQAIEAVYERAFAPASQIAAT